MSWNPEHCLRLNRLAAGAVFSEKRPIFPHMFVFDTHTRAWRAAPDLPSGRCSLGVCNINGIIFAVGGHANTARSSVWKLDVRGWGGAKEKGII